MSDSQPSFARQIPEGDNRPRMVCTRCGWIHYDNPRIVVGAVSTWEDRILLCRRAIEPRKGFWTIPAGFLEENESPEEGAVRETVEEAGARIEPWALLGVYAIPHISQVHLIYEARMLGPEHAPGAESLEAILVPWEAIPWEELAFPTVHWALRHHRQVEGQSRFAPFTRPADGEGGHPLPR